MVAVSDKRMPGVVAFSVSLTSHDLFLYMPP